MEPLRNGIIKIFIPRKKVVLFASIVILKWIIYKRFIGICEIVLVTLI